jgi:hypothetical protein
LAQFARHIKTTTQAIIGGNYPGVDIVFRNGVFTAYDGTTIPSPTSTDILFTDLIGQPTYLNPYEVQAIVVMRGDLHVGGYIKLPPGPVITAPQGNAYFKDKPTFQGVFQINRMRHAGNFRQSDATSWVTVLDLGKVS